MESKASYGEVFWTNGRLEILRYCHSVFRLRCDGLDVMPISTFEVVTSYMYAEFDVELL